MNRRQAASKILAISGLTFYSSVLLEACKKPNEKVLHGMILTDDQVVFLDEFSDTLIPDTPDSPGAKAAKCGNEMSDIIKNCISYREGKTYVDLIESIKDSSKKEFNKEFQALSYLQKVKILTPFDFAKSEAYIKLKELTVFVYFTSEIGMTQALRYVEVPARLDGCMPLEKGDKSWAWTFS